jgi:2-polyprenyl-3-methyl-5-hydroxy-6-metoxy-1,4-benzoquinol methylase
MTENTLVKNAISAPLCPICERAGAALWLTVGGQPIFRCGNCRCGFRDLRIADASKKEDIQLSAFGERYVRSRNSISALLRLEAKRSLKVLRRVVTPPAKLLEIGCATGEFCHCAAVAGYQVEGLEISEASALAATVRYGLRVHTASLEELCSQELLYDVIVAIHTLEHFRAPKEVVKQIYRLLAPGGKLLIEVPSVDSWTVRLRAEQSGVFTDEHYVLHSEQSLGTLLCDGGFDVIKVYSQEGYFGLLNTVMDWLGIQRRGLAIARWVRGKQAAVPTPSVNGRVATPPRRHAVSSFAEASIDLGRAVMVGLSAGTGLVLTPVRMALSRAGAGGSLIALAEKKHA